MKFEHYKYPNLVHQMMAKRMTRADVGGIVGATKGTVTNWLHGYSKGPCIDDALKIARAFGKSADYLFDTKRRGEEWEPEWED